VNDPRCVFVYSAEQIMGYPAIVMELMPGGTLQDEINARGALPPREAVDRILDVVDGLAAAHRAGVLHRDVKPSNCFVDAEGRLKIGDFGISTTLEGPSLMLTGSFIGTPMYASPEQARGRDLDERSDIYSLGATLYAALAGRPPFAGVSAGEVIARVVSEDPPAIERSDEKLPNGLESIVRRMLAKDPAERFSTYRAVRSALLPFSSSALSIGGLAQRLGANLFDSFLVTVLVEVPLSALTSLDSASRLIKLLLEPSLYYFTITEGVWGRSLGKLIFRLRVGERSGGQASWPRIVVRTLFYVIVPFSKVVQHALAYAGVSAPLPGLFIAILMLDDAIVLLTIRRRNGYAGIHELISGTRTFSRKAATIAAVPHIAYDVAPIESAGHAGPFRETGRVWQTADEALLMARDDVLQRDVWIHRFTGDRALSMARLARMGATRLRWLNGAREATGCWDAYDAPHGAALVDWVPASGLSWCDVRVVLASLTGDVQSIEDVPQVTMALDRIWVDARGRAMLAPFPVPVRRASPAFATEVQPGDWQTFVLRVTQFSLEGRIRDEGGVPRVPVPEYARELVHRISLRGFDRLDELSAELHRIEDRPAVVDASRRAGTLVLSTLTVGAALLLATALLAGDSGSAQMTTASLVACALPPAVYAAAGRGGFWFRMFGIALQDARGGTPGRLRCAVRSLIVWLPVAAIARAFWVKLEPHRLTFGFNVPMSVFWMMVLGLIAVAAIALLRPDRGVPDVICGTRLVPR
jgi:eukaryotic-like serine/threonine-protein kinase